MSVFHVSTLEFLSKTYPPTLTVEQVSEITSEQPQTIRNLISQGRYRVPSFKIGRRRVFRLVDIAEFIDQQLLADPSYRNVVEVQAMDMGGLQPTGYPDVYQTGVAGIGIRVMIKDEGLGQWRVPPWSFTYQGSLPFSLPQRMRIELVRIAAGVTTGDIHLPNFSFQFLPPNRGELSATYRPANPSTIKVVNPVFFEGCMPLDKVRNVPMGKELARGIQAGTASKKDFSFEIRCEGKPNKCPGQLLSTLARRTQNNRPQSAAQRTAMRQHHCCVLEAGRVVVMSSFMQVSISYPGQCPNTSDFAESRGSSPSTVPRP